MNKPEVLYHYTTQLGLLGIFKSNSIWATKIHYLNDASEYLYTIRKADEYLCKRLKSETNSKTNDKIKCLIENLRCIEQLNICVCSFSAHQDMLSQWRAYAEETSGFSIGFNVNHLQKQAKEAGFELVECIYDKEEQQNLIEGLLEETLNKDFNTVSCKRDENRPRTFIALRTGGDFRERISRLAPRIKSNAFREETEWRLISTSGVSVFNMKYRPGKSMITPYTEIELGEDKNSYLDSITIGPSPHSEQSKLAVRIVLAHWRAAHSVSVSASEASYRNW